MKTAKQIKIKFYIGQTGRNFNNRIDEHKCSYVKSSDNCTYVNYIIEENHVFHDKFEILFMEQNNKKLNLLETLILNNLKNSYLSN